MSRVVITGAAGFIGSHLSEALLDRGDSVVGVDNLSTGDIERAIGVFRGLTSEQRAGLPGIQAGREDVILAGALIAREACRLLDVDAMVASEADTLDGVALALATAG